MGAQPSLPDKGVGLTPLMVACCSGHKTWVRAWLENFPDCDLDQRNRIGQTALISASVLGGESFEVVSMLLEAKANPSLSATLGGNLLWCLASNPDNNVHLIKALLDSPSGPHINDRMVPRMVGHLVGSAARMAVRLGAKGKAVHFIAGIEGATVLHCAAAFATDVELCEVLVQSKADVAARNASGMTPIQFARVLQTGSADKMLPNALKQLLTSPASMPGRPARCRWCLRRR